MDSHPMDDAPEGIIPGAVRELELIRARLADRKPRHFGQNGLIPAAVALPLILKPGGLRVVLTVRADTVEHHKNEISFPGGRIDDGDADPLSAALRETWEEIGIPASAFTVLGELDEFRSISGYRVRTFVMFLKDSAPAYNPHSVEVSEIIEVPLGHLMDPANHRVDTTTYPGRGPLQYFNWENRTIWGLTGAILRQFLEVAFDFEGEGVNSDY